MNEGLNEFLRIYPRKDDETAVYLEWNRQVRNQQTIDDILTGTRAWVSYWQTELTPTQFIPKPVSFLRSKQWMDVPAKSKGKIWTPPSVPTRRWTAQEAHEPILSKPIAVKPTEAQEPIKSFRTAAEILAQRKASR